MKAHLEFLKSLNFGDPNPQLHLDISRGCNLRCPMCTFHDKKNDKSYVDAQTFYNLGNEVSMFGYVSIGQGSEPFINPDWYEIVKFITDRGPKVSLQTNAKLIKDATFAEAIVKSGLYILGFSIDGLSDKTVSRIRKGITAKEIFRAIDLVNEAKARLKSETPIFMANITAMRLNIDEMAPLVERLINKNFRKLRLGPVELRQPNEDLVPQLLIYDTERTFRMIKEVKSVITNSGKNIYLDDIPSNIETFSKKNSCSVYKDIFYATSWGDFHACYTKLLLGDLFKDGVKKCLPSHAYDEFVLQVTTSGNSICSNCRYCNVMGFFDIFSHFGPESVQYYTEDSIRDSVQWVKDGGSPEEYWENYYMKHSSL